MRNVFLYPPNLSAVERLSAHFCLSKSFGPMRELGTIGLFGESVMLYFTV